MPPRGAASSWHPSAADVDEAQQEVEVVMECTMACQQLGLLSPFGREAKHVGNVVRGRGGG